ncbi:MAG: hypothetical protein HPY58_09785 [Firmicutes bacterium]|nr:hypothetical protein [Bacillota bacterium]
MAKRRHKRTKQTRKAASGGRLKPQAPAGAQKAAQQHRVQAAQKGKVVPLGEKGRRGKVVPLDVKGRGKRRFRFRLPAGAVERLEKIREGVGRSWRELAIRLRLGLLRRGAASPGKEAPSAGRRPAPETQRLSQVKWKGKGAAPGRGKGLPRPGGRPGSRTAAALRARWEALGARRPGVRAAAGELGALLRRAAAPEGIVALMLAALLFYPPYFRGLFFARELLPTHMFTAVIFSFFAFYKISRRELVFFRHPLDYAVFLLLGLYVASSINAWNTRDAVGAVLKMANYAAVYWLLAFSVRSLNAVQSYLKVFFASGTGVALLGLGAAFGTFHYKDAFVGGRIFSSLQYPNTLAAYLTAINLFGLYLLAGAGRLASRILLAVGNYLLFLTFLGTQSRGAYLIYPLGLLILLAGLPGKERWRALGNFGLQVLAVFAVAGRVVACTGGRAELAGWLWVLAGAVLAAVFQWVWASAEARLARRSSSLGTGNASAGRRRLRPWVLPAAAAFGLLILAGGACALWQERAAVAAFAGRAVPEAWAARVKSISLQEKNAQERLLWSRDAFKIMTASPLNSLLGAGGGGWNALYHRYQDYLYFSTEVHNHFLQVGVETGFPGLLTFLAIWVFFFGITWRTLRCTGGSPQAPAGPGGADSPPLPQQAVRGTAWAIFSGALALGLHSLIDFNLSLGAVALLLWGLFGLGRGLGRLADPAGEIGVGALGTGTAGTSGRGRTGRFSRFQLSPALQGVLVGSVAAVLFLTSMSLLLGQKYALAASQALKRQDVQGAVSAYERALEHDPWTSSYRAGLAQIYLFQGEQKQDAGLLRKAQELLADAVRANRGDPQLRVLYGRALFSTGRLEEGLAQLEEAVALMPFKQDLYESLAAGYLGAGLFLLEQAGQAKTPPVREQQGDPARLKERGRRCLEQALAVPERIERTMASVPEKHKQYWVRAPLLAVSPQIHLYAGEAAALLARWPQADTCLAAAAQDPALKPEALLWRGLALKKRGRTEEGEELVTEALKLKPDLAGEQEKIEALLRAASGRPS